MKPHEENFHLSFFCLDRLCSITDIFCWWTNRKQRSYGPQRRKRLMRMSPKQAHQVQGPRLLRLRLQVDPPIRTVTTPICRPLQPLPVILLHKVWCIGCRSWPNTWATPTTTYTTCGTALRYSVSQYLYFTILKTSIGSEIISSWYCEIVTHSCQIQWHNVRNYGLIKLRDSSHIINFNNTTILLNKLNVEAMIK